MQRNNTQQKKTHILGKRKIQRGMKSKQRKSSSTGTSTICKNLNFSDCELAILRMAVDSAETKMGMRVANSPDVQKIINILEDFLKVKNLICYGGTAINNILPESDQFYDKNVEIPDYDFFSFNALNDAKELADIYFKKGFVDVEAKAGQHHGTFKVYVNYIPIADITLVPKEIFNALKKDAIRVAGILYAPPNFLRMAMYLELSRPAGDISRWEKVLKRLTALNKNYPLTTINCKTVEIQRKMVDDDLSEKIYHNVKKTLIDQGVVLFGGAALSYYSKHMPAKSQKYETASPDFDVIAHEPETVSEIVKERLKDIGVMNTKIIHHDAAGEIIPEHCEIKVGKDTIAFIYKPIGCHSYNIIVEQGQHIKVATIDTMLSFYLAFLYAERPYYNEFSERILCMSKFLFDVQQKNRLSQDGVLKRFSINCYGHQDSIEEIRAKKAEKYKELKLQPNQKELDEWFLNYRPDKQQAHPQTFVHAEKKRSTTTATRATRERATRATTATTSTTSTRARATTVTAEEAHPRRRKRKTKKTFFGFFGNKRRKKTYKRRKY